MASIPPSEDHQLGELGEAEWLREVSKVIDKVLAEQNNGYLTLFDQTDLTVMNALTESDYSSPNLSEWTTSEENTTFGNALAELDYHDSSNQVELPDPTQVQINDFIKDVQITEASLVILPNSGGSTSIVPQQKAKHPRKKPIRWTSDEHRLFLEGLDRYGRGDWRSISRFSVVTRTPAQVASHAQKYFISLKRSQNNHGNSNPATANAAAPSPH